MALPTEEGPAVGRPGARGGRGDAGLEPEAEAGGRLHVRQSWGAGAGLSAGPLQMVQEGLAAGSQLGRGG